VKTTPKPLPMNKDDEQHVLKANVIMAKLSAQKETFKNKIVIAKLQVRTDSKNLKKSKNVMKTMNKVAKTASKTASKTTAKAAPKVSKKQAQAKSDAKKSENDKKAVLKKSKAKMNGLKKFRDNLSAKIKDQRNSIYKISGVYNKIPKAPKSEPEIEMLRTRNNIKKQKVIKTKKDIKVQKKNLKIA